MSRDTKICEDNNEIADVSLPVIRKPGPLKIWNVVDGFKKVDGQSKPVKIVLQEIPEDRYNDILDHMFTYFIYDEPCCSSLKVAEDPIVLQDFRNIWTVILKQGLSVGAFVEDLETGKSEIAGANIMGVEIKSDDKKVDNLKLKSPITERLIGTVVALSKEAKIYETYKVDRYMFAFGLSVHPSYRGHALGGHILNTRLQIGREHKIPVTSTAFTSEISQKLATRCGFDVCFEKDYDKIVDEDGKHIFPGIKFKTFKVMARRLY